MTKKHKTRQRSDQGEVAEKFDFLVSLLKKADRFKMLKQGVPAREAVNDAIRRAYKRVYGYSKKAPHTSPAPVYLRKLDSLYLKSKPKLKKDRSQKRKDNPIQMGQDFFRDRYSMKPPSLKGTNGSLRENVDLLGKGVEDLETELRYYKGFVDYHRMDVSFEKFKSVKALEKEELDVEGSKRVEEEGK
jgi:hypothetical protein